MILQITPLNSAPAFPATCAPDNRRYQWINLKIFTKNVIESTETKTDQFDLRWIKIENSYDMSDIGSDGRHNIMNAVNIVTNWKLSPTHQYHIAFKESR